MAVNPDAVPWLGSGVIILVNVIGWVIAQSRSKVAIKQAADAAKTAAVVELAAYKVIVSKLPCVRNDDYQFNQGVMQEAVENLKEQTKSNSTKLDRLLEHFKMES